MQRHKIMEEKFVTCLFFFFWNGTNVNKSYWLSKSSTVVKNLSFPGQRTGPYYSGEKMRKRDYIVIFLSFPLEKRRSETTDSKEKFTPRFTKTFVLLLFTNIVLLFFSTFLPWIQSRALFTLSIILLHKCYGAFPHP